MNNEFGIYSPIIIRLRTILVVCSLICFPSCTSSHANKNETAEKTVQEETDTLPSTLSLLFVGDLMQHQSQIDAAKRAHGYDYTASFRHIEKEIRKADIAIGNLECSLGGTPYAGYPCFSAPDEFLSAIHKAGFDVLSTANNHCLDRGSKGGLRTIQLLDSLSIPHLGTYTDSISQAKKHPLIIEKNGIRLAFIAYTYATNGIKATPPFRVNYINEKQIKEDILKAKALKPDAIIALMHWGEEYHSNPSKAQKALAEKLFAQGVTHVIGSHPHVVQPIELRTDSTTSERQLLVYSLGNFISGMSANKTDGGLIVRMTLKKHKQRTTLSHADYSLVWTLRPPHNPQKDYSLIPPSRIDSLQPSAQYLFRRFLKQARTLFQEKNIGIEENDI